MAESGKVIEKNPSRRKRVVIVGGGFAGLHAAKGLASEPVDVILVDRRNHHTFQPLLYHVALAVLSPADIAQPIRSIVRDQENIQVLMDEVVDINVTEQKITLGSGAFLDYDYLCLATGSSHSYFGHDDWAPLAPGLKAVEDATEIRRRILLAFELAEQRAIETGIDTPLKFVVVGGGPTGVELAGAISDIAKYLVERDFRHIDMKKISISLYEGLPRILSSYPEDLSESAARQLESLGVRVFTNSTVEEIKPGYLIVNKKRVEAAVILWAAGVQASALGRKLGTPVDRRGCVIVDDFLNPPGYTNVFVLGDLAHVEENGRQIPGVAQPAMQMGDYAADAIRRDISRLSRKKFHYFDKGDMATIGRNKAVAKLEWPFKAHWSGFMAWITWLVVHIYFLIGFRNRLLVLTQWVWTYFTFSHSARLITGNPKLVGWDEMASRHADAKESQPATAHATSATS